jgi:isopenicillin N synthase-like dioxygenase
MGSIGEPVQKGVEQDDLVMPLIDFGLYMHGSPSVKQATATEISHAFKTSGFLYLQNHGVPTEEVARAFSESASFFARSQSQKDALGWTTPDANRGYVASGREKVTQSDDPEVIAKLRESNPDLKESMEIGREGVDGMPNQWPDQLDEEGKTFTKDMQAFFLTLKDLHINVMRAIALGMGLDEQFFDSFTDNGDNTLRLLHYPPVKKSVWKKNPNQVRAGEHSDYGSITLLFQDDIGGLEVKSPRGTWVRATPIPGTIVVNAGDLLSRWSNDLIRSTNHRVIQPPPKPTPDGEEDDPDALIPARYSIAYFCNPNFDKYIEALPGTYEESGKKYDGINSGDYLVMRLAATY